MSSGYAPALPERLANRSLFWRAAMVLLGAALLTATAWAEIPLYPVPINLQTFGVIFIAAVAGPRLAVEIVLAYLVEAAAGLPVLSGGAGGASHLIGPTGGYLIGFLVAAAVIGRITRKAACEVSGLVRLSLAAMAGQALILLCGWVWLSVALGPKAAFTAGVAPFLLGGALKIAMAVTAVLLTEPLLRRRSPA